MSNKIGRFEIVSQLAQSPFATIYKARDTESDQTVALKVVRLDQVKDRDVLLKRVFDEAEQAKPLSSHNIAALYGVGDEAEQLLASVEYVQGNSIATTLGRHEGFSIWDLQDIAREVCHALDHAQGHRVAHQSLEPAKIMVQWDGQVKVLGFGISTMSTNTVPADATISQTLHYASPEQLRGEACDHRSTLFSLGAILYEMATEQKPFAGETAEQIREGILEKLPVQPLRLKANVNRGLSDLIMKALAKSPSERYQSGQELIRDLEQCKASSVVAVGAPGAVKAAKAAPPAWQKPKINAAAAGAASTSTPEATASSAPAAEPESAFKVDPLMADGGVAPATSTSFSDITELPALKEVRIIPSTPSAVEEPLPQAMPVSTFRKTEAEKPAVQVREAAQQAVAVIRKVPPRLLLYSIGVAVLLITIIAAAMALRNYLADRDDSGSSSAAAPVTDTGSAASKKPTAPAPSQPPTQTLEPQAATEPGSEPMTSRPDTSAAEPAAAAPATHGRGKRKSSTAAPAVVAAQLAVSSSPAGAEITFDGTALCQSPCTLTGIAPGQHTVTASKAGFAAVTRSLSVSAGANLSVSLPLNQLTAMLSVTSTPAGAVILIDGKDSGRLTPSQISMEKAGAHTVTLRRAGYLEATSSVTIDAGQTSTVNLALTHLGNTEEIRAAGGKFKKVFGSGDASGMGIVSIKTQPKGAQIMVNNRVLDKTAPFDFYLNPGTYVVDITMSGYRGIHRVVSIQEGEKLAIQETLLPE